MNMSRSVTIQDEQDHSVKKLSTTNSQFGNEQNRKNFYAIAAFLGGIASITVALTPPFIDVIFFDFAGLSFGLAWLVIAGLYKFSSIQLRKLFNASFFLILSQFICNDVLPLFVIEHSTTTFFTTLINTLLFLVVIIISSFILFSTKTAVKVSSITTGLSLGLIFTSAVNLSSEFLLITLIQPTVFIAVSIFLIRALALFRNDADVASNQAEHYEQLALYDVLTGIANRRKLVSDVQKEMTTAQRYDLPLSIIIFDIDHFKKVNDTYGHNIGDQVLKSVSEDAKLQVRATDSLGRWGGEEFLCIMPNTSATVAFELAERLRMGIESLAFENGPTVTASFGIAQLIQSDDFDSFLNRADKALYEAKESGRNCCKPTPLSDGNSFETLPVLNPSSDQVQQLN